MPPPPDPPVARVFVFDDRLGTHESDEFDKLLAVFPADTPCDDCCATAGLAQGVCGFLGPFVEGGEGQGKEVKKSKGSTAVKGEDMAKKKTSQRSLILSGSTHRQVCLECEPHIWWVVELDKFVFPQSRSRDAAVKKVIQQAHEEYVFLHDSVQSSLILLTASTVNQTRCKLAPVVASLGLRLTPSERNAHDKNSHRHFQWRAREGPGSLYEGLRFEGLSVGVLEASGVSSNPSDDIHVWTKSALNTIAKKMRVKPVASLALYFPNKGTPRVVLGDTSGLDQNETAVRCFISFCMRCFASDVWGDVQGTARESEENTVVHRSAKAFAFATRSEAETALMNMKKWKLEAGRRNSSDEPITDEKTNQPDQPDTTPFMGTEVSFGGSVTIKNGSTEVVPASFEGKNGDRTVLIFLVKKSKKTSTFFGKSESVSTLQAVVDGCNDMSKVHGLISTAAREDEQSQLVTIPHLSMEYQSGNNDDVFSHSSREILDQVSRKTFRSVSETIDEYDLIKQGFGTREYEPSLSRMETPHETCHRSAHDAWVSRRVNAHTQSSVTCVLEGENLTLLEAVGAAETFRETHIGS